MADGTGRRLGIAEFSVVVDEADLSLHDVSCHQAVSVRAGSRQTTVAPAATIPMTSFTHTDASARRFLQQVPSTIRSS